MLYGVIAQVNSEAKHYFYTFHFISHTSRSKGGFSHRLTSSLYKMKASISHFLIGHLLWREVQVLKKTLIHFDWILQEHNHLHLRSRWHGLASFIFKHYLCEQCCVQVCGGVWSWPELFVSEEVSTHTNKEKRKAKSDCSCLPVQATLGLNYDLISIFSWKFH